MTRRFPFFVQAPPAQAEKGDDPEGACDRAIVSVTEKADRNERLSRWITFVIIVSSALIPVFVLAGTAGHPFLWGKLAPSLLAAVSAAAAGLLQFERPHERWKLYRGYQRALEDVRFRYHNRLPPYDQGDEDDRRRRLGLTVSEIEAQLHRDWGGLMPASAAVAAATVETGQSSSDGS
ncbi:MAG: DUF4231 domain-containing protein [Baekduia sp.]